MKLTPIAKRIASQIAKQFATEFVDVEWNFTRNSFDAYDPIADETTSSRITRNVKLLAYPVESSDANSNFSSTGVFIDSPQDLDKCQVLMVWDQLPNGVIPTNKDTFQWGDKIFNVRNVQTYPTQAVYIMEAWR